MSSLETSSVRLRGVSFSYASDRRLFDGLDLHLTPGWTGIVGPNGHGKTTLLRLLTGELVPIRGAIYRDGATVALCRQRVDACTPEIKAFGWDWDRTACRVRGRLDLNPEALQRWSTLSPGERKRWQLGAALAAEPDVLLLDEPTNHLDASGREQLVTALRRFRGIGLVVSHDRALLEALTDRTLRVGHGTARLWPGSYLTAKAAWEAEEGLQLAELESAQAARRKARRHLADQRRRLDATQRQIGAKARMKNAGDREAASINRKERARKATAKLSSQLGVIRRRSDDAATAVGDARQRLAPRAHGGGLFVDYHPSPKRRLATLELPTLEAGRRVLARDVRLTLERDSRWRIAGPNGAGKTTLLTQLEQALTIPDERVLCVPQHLSPEALARYRAALDGLDPPTRGRVLSIVADLGVDPDILLATASPSPGEARKLAIALGLARQVWLLVLDEPTNHLDLPSVERLESALGEYPGALVLVSHDDAFAGRLTQKTVTLVPKTGS